MGNRPVPIPSNMHKISADVGTKDRVVSEPWMGWTDHKPGRTLVCSEYAVGGLVSSARNRHFWQAVVTVGRSLIRTS